MFSVRKTILFMSIALLIGVVYVTNGYALTTDQSGIIVGRQAYAFGLVDIKSDSHSLDIGVINYNPPEGKVFEVWLYDGNYGASQYLLTVGMVKEDETFGLKSTPVYPYTYTDLFVTLEPKDDKDPKPVYSDQVGVYPLSPLFGQ